MVVIIATTVDPHADMVVELLRAENIPHQRIDLEAPVGHYEITVRGGDVAPTWTIRDIATERLLRSNYVTAVWWRRSSSYLFPKPPQSAEEVDHREAGTLLRWLIEALPASLFPFGHPVALRHAENKARQWTSAWQSGLALPPFLFTTTGCRAIAFAQKNHGIVLKSLSQALAMLPEGESSFRAVALTESQLIASLPQESTQFAAFLQRQVHRSIDVRAFIGKGWHLAVEIRTADLPKGEIDWRPFVDGCAHTPARLPAELITKVEHFLDHMGIPCGHFDFIKDDAGEYHFLECNPNGQWAWLEFLAGVPVARTIFSELRRTHERNTTGVRE